MSLSRRDRLSRRDFVALASGAAALGLAACAQSAGDQGEQAQDASAEDEQQAAVDLHAFEDLELDTKAWKYDEENDVYYQLGVPYCLNPVSQTYESLAIFVPGPYFVAEKAGKAYACEIDEQGKVGNFTPSTAPVLMPINSGALGPQASPTSYSYGGLSSYLNAGCVYVYAGFRGRSSGYESGSSDVYAGGDPWPVVDLKAAIRFLRYNAAALPCDTSRLFAYGFSAGGGVSAVLGSSGDSELYAPYLEEVGAAAYDAQGEPLSDAIMGSASWCPVTSFDTADASYEWMMGQYADEGTRAEGTWTRLLSHDLAGAYAAYVNDMDLRDAQDRALSLDETSGELYADGSYYTHMLSCIQDAATSFFASTAFPYIQTPQHLVNANFPGDPNLQSAGAGTSDVEAVTGDASAQAAGASPAETGATEGMTQVQSAVYATPEDYVDVLNKDGQWLTYNQTKATVRISSLGDFVRHLKVAAKDVCAFDSLERSTVENQLFGVDEAGSVHFSTMVRDQLAAGRDRYAQATGWSDEIVREWEEDLTTLDSLGQDMATRMNMFNPLYFVSGRYEGYGTAGVAPYWRINAGLFQTDTSLCTEMNLALALGQYEGVRDVAFAPVWGQGHVLAELSGTAEENLLSWVLSCCQE